METKKEQKKICDKYQTIYFETPHFLKVGVSISLKNKDIFPINGLRHNPEGDTSGWYIWAGEEFSEDENFFIPLHIEHIEDWRDEILKYLALPPGYRFLIGKNGYEDVWFDETLLNMESI